MEDNGLYSNYRLTARIELKNVPGAFAGVANLLAAEKVILGAVDIVQVSSEKIIRDITFDVKNEEHGRRVTEELNQLNNVHVVSVSDRIFLLHLGGKIRVESKVPLATRNQLSMAYTPGVARVCQAIAADPSKVHALTIKGNCVAVVTDGSAILGLGNLGPEAALPVMEGKAMIFKEFAGIDAFPICLDTQDTEEIIRVVELIAPVFGAVNLEDISCPRCFEIEDRLKASLDIPVMHDDQHGTAVVVLAALQNALKLVKKDIGRIKVVVSGLGAAGVACAKILISAGVTNIMAANRKGIVMKIDDQNVQAAREDILSCIHRDDPVMTLRESLADADVFVGVSSGNILSADDVRTMHADPIVFAAANPDPEIDPQAAVKVCRIFATGRSDLPNQINNALAYPGIFRGALNVRARGINEEMKLAAARAIAELIPSDQLSEEYIVPSIFDKRVVEAVAAAVEHAAHDTGVARKRSLQESEI